MWDFIDKALYINLEHRGDRRTNMEKFFKDGGIPDEKIQRINAFYTPENGLVGCAQSHISALEQAKANNWKAVLITEDDLEWVDFERLYPNLEELVNSMEWDVCMLTGIYSIYNEPIIRLACYTNAYIVKSHYYDTLLENFKEGLKLKKDALMKEKFAWTRISLPPSYKHIYNVDIYWNSLQVKDTWIGLPSHICKQIMSYSDINKEVIQPPPSIYGI